MFSHCVQHKIWPSRLYTLRFLVFFLTRSPLPLPSKPQPYLLFFSSLRMLSLELLYYLLSFPRIWIPLIFYHWLLPNIWDSIQMSPSQSGLPLLPNLKHSSSLYHPVLLCFHISTYYYQIFPLLCEGPSENASSAGTEPCHSCVLPYAQHLE